MPVSLAAIFLPFTVNLLLASQSLPFTIHDTGSAPLTIREAAMPVSSSVFVRSALLHVSDRAKLCVIPTWLKQAYADWTNYKLEFSGFRH